MIAYVDFRSDPREIWDRYKTYRGDLAFDIGANGGMVANILAANFESVIAFEPCEESFQQLRNSARPNVVPEMVAVSDFDGEVTLLEAEKTMGMGELVTGTSLPMAWGATTGERTVPAITLDAAVETYGIPDFIKIDTEGHELAIVEGGLTFLTDHEPRLLIEVHSEENGKVIREHLAHRLMDEVRHQAYTPDSYYWTNHYYLVSVP